ncbi:unnamed protein product [Angiostrongylus costaricensis]|uniref:FLZ-type domain-containing protein n=1 Tax=Angiostrongylus costaricensis TaxID=334426 RepID=A0A0R3PNV1_ANGCS|nr:unnamed protein product [Angiostrongylus costaricensis]
MARGSLLIYRASAAFLPDKSGANLPNLEGWKALVRFSLVCDAMIYEPFKLSINEELFASHILKARQRKHSYLSRSFCLKCADILPGRVDFNVHYCYGKCVMYEKNLRYDFKPYDTFLHIAGGSSGMCGRERESCQASSVFSEYATLALFDAHPPGDFSLRRRPSRFN